MTGTDFFDAVEAHPELEGTAIQHKGEEIRDIAGHKGVVPEDRLLVTNTRLAAQYAVTLKAIEGESWKDIEAVLTNARPGKVIDHMSRVVGYYSKTSNWNRSKLGELAARRRGNYTIP